MRLTEFEELSLAVNFHDELNPSLWVDGRMQPEVRSTLLRIANHFKDFLGIDLFDLVDITVSGSNAAYTYTPNSDIDLHLVVMIPDEHRQELKELFNAKKYQYNDQHDIKVRGFDVELYVQDAEETLHSMGIYSVSRGTWIQQPKRQRAQIDDIEVQEKYRSMKHRINQAIIDDDQDRVQAVWDSVKDMRRAGLARAGEFSPENLTFKILRADGTLDKLYRHMGNLQDMDLGLEEDDAAPGSNDTAPSQPEIYLDMDGVLADFFAGYNHITDHPVSHPDDIPPAKMDPTLQKMVGSDFFATLPKYQSTDALVALVVKLFGHYNICSSPLRGDHENSAMNKNIWISQHLKPQPRDVIITANKSKFAQQPNGTPNVLIDDKPSNVSAWIAAGGIGILYQADRDGLDTVAMGLKPAFAAMRRQPSDLTESVEGDIPHQEEILHFIRWVYDNQHIKGQPPRIIFSKSKDSPGMHHTGWFNNKENTMWVYTHDRNLIDIMRTVAHELTHVKQGSQGRIKGHSPAGSKLEREADEKAGIIMKLYGKQHPEIIQ